MLLLYSARTYYFITTQTTQLGRVMLLLYSARTYYFITTQLERVILLLLN